jgi:hypothetical protein
MSGRIISFVPSGFGRLLLTALLVLGILLLLTSVAMAQDVTPPGLDTQPITPTWLITAFTFFVGTGLVAGVVQLLKYIPGNTIDAGVLKEWVAGVVSLIFMGFVLSGHTDLFGSGADMITRLLPFISGFLGVFGGSSVTHNVAASIGVPLLGYKRTPQRE